jgi:hypothetical protein
MAEEGEELVQKIETGDSIKIKQVLDEAVIETVTCCRFLPLFIPLPSDS